MFAGGISSCEVLETAQKLSLSLNSLSSQTLSSLEIDIEVQTRRKWTLDQGL